MSSKLVDFPVKLVYPSTILVSGPKGRGKTQLVSKLITASTQTSSKAATPGAAAIPTIAATGDVEEQPGAHPDEGVRSGMDDEEMRAQATEITNFIDKNRNVVNYNPKIKQLIINWKVIKSSNLTRILRYILDQSGHATRPSCYITFLHT